MVKKYEKVYRRSRHNQNVKADVIILGCTLPGIVTAHKLKKRFGDAMDIVVLDLAQTESTDSKFNVAFQITEDDDDNNIDQTLYYQNIAKQYLTKFTDDLHIPLPDAIIAPETIKNTLTKVFQHSDGYAVPCDDNYHDFSYLNIVERFELNQYQKFLDESMRQLFVYKCSSTEKERQMLLYYDRTAMDIHICGFLLFPTSREVMRVVVRLVCGAAADTVSILFYLHQCYRTNGCKNHLDGANTKLREKLMGYCRKRIKTQLKQSVADITLPAKPIKLIRNYSAEEVVLETKIGEANYVCNLLAMALKPDELQDITVDEELISRERSKMYRSMTPGRAKKFIISYNDNFWRQNGYSGDIFSMQGPIIWATEKPKLSTTGSEEKFAALIGYLKVGSQTENNSKDTVVAQLVKLFGEKAMAPVFYKETEIADVYIPRCGDFVSMKTSQLDTDDFRLDWRALDVFADGDVASALEAGNSAYLHLLRLLRPQAECYEDLCARRWRRVLEDSPFRRWMAQVNYKFGMRLAVCTIGLLIGARLFREYLRK